MKLIMRCLSNFTFTETSVKKRKPIETIKVARKPKPIFIFKLLTILSDNFFR